MRRLQRTLATAASFSRTSGLSPPESAAVSAYRSSAQTLCSQPPCDQHDRTRRGVEGPRGWGRGPGSSPGTGHRHYIERTFLERWLQSRHVLEKHWFVPYGYENHSTALSCDLIDIQIATTDNSAVVVTNFFNKKHFFKMLIHLILLYVQSHVFQNHSAG